MTLCHVDFETKCILDLKTCGLDRYSKQAEVLILGWAFDEDEVQIWDPRFGPLPKEVCAAIRSDCSLVAWNSGFERAIFKNVLGLNIPIQRWIDPSTYARYLSLPGSLQSVSDILGLGGEGKDTDGKRLIDLFCKPASMGGEITLFGTTEPYFREPEKHPLDWLAFKEYCKQDVKAERKLLRDLKDFELPPIEKKIWYLDQRINETGIPVNRAFVKKALELAERSKQELNTTLKEKTNLENPNSRDQMLEWCRSQRYPFQSLEKASVQYALAGTNITSLCREVLLVRKEAAKISYKKLEAILSRLGDDDFLRDQFLYLGAARTGRWSGGGGGKSKGVQFQNMPRPTKEVENNLERTLAQIEALDYDAIKSEHPSVVTAVTSCIRSVFQTSVGSKFAVCDLSGIENRVLGWCANEDAILKVFRDKLDPYVAFAVLMYQKPYEILLNDKEKRQISKSAVLGCGFGLGPGVDRNCARCKRTLWAKEMSCKKCGSVKFNYEAVQKDNGYGDLAHTGLLAYAENMGIKITPQQAWMAQQTFRKSYPKVVELWAYSESAAKQVISDGGEVKVGPVTFSRLEWDEKFIMRVLLPSGRALHYFNVSLVDRILTGSDGAEYEKQTIMYDGIGHGVGTVSEAEGGKGSKFGPTYTYGGKIVENFVQAIARDILAHGMLLADEAGASICGHAHDEILVLGDDNPLDFSLDDLRYCMSQSPDWARDLPLDSAGFESKIYKKG